MYHDVSFEETNFYQQGEANNFGYKHQTCMLGFGIRFAYLGINFGVKSVDRQFHQPKRMHSTVV